MSQTKESTDDSEALRSALAAENSQPYVLVLFVAGPTPNSTRAIRNTQEMCEQYLANRHSLTIVDLYQQPQLASEEQVIAAPTLIRKLPLPVKRLVGDMQSTTRILLPADLAASRPKGSSP